MFGPVQGIQNPPEEDMCIPVDETVGPSGKSLVSLRNLSPSGKVMCIPDDETISSSEEALDLSKGTSIKPLDKTYD